MPDTQIRYRNAQGLVPLDVAQRAVDEALAKLEDWRVGLLEVMEWGRDEGGVHGPSLAKTFAPCFSKETYIHLAFGFGQPCAGEVQI